MIDHKLPTLKNIAEYLDYNVPMLQLDTLTDEPDLMDVQTTFIKLKQCETIKHLKKCCEAGLGGIND